MDLKARLTKRLFDIVFAALGLMFITPIMLPLIAVCRWDTGRSGLFRQERIGRFGKPFTLYKLRTMRDGAHTNVTIQGDPRITKCGAILRRFKLDELPQLWNVLRGDMTFVGPRPDMAGYLDQLEGTDKRLQILRPGITGPASLKYRNEEALLAKAVDPQRYNDRVLWPDKVRINLAYLDSWSFATDLHILRKTLLP
ncbi:MAG: sugar transferase [Pseudomonadota bacterium]